jgi:pimeloyl-ACP methyl ester carboxylesterase
MTTLRGSLLSCLLGMTMTATARAQSLALGWQAVDGVNLFYREGGPRDAPTIVFLPGNPLSSIQYVRVMEQLIATHAFHVLSVDYPSFGYSDAPAPSSYRYTFDHVANTVRAFLGARGVTRYGLYMQDYGVPIGFRLISDSPDSITTIVVQNGVIHLDGFPSAQDENGDLRRHWRSRNPVIDQRRVAAWKALSFPAAGWSGGDQPSPDVFLLTVTSAQRPGVIEARSVLFAAVAGRTLGFASGSPFGASSSSHTPAVRHGMWSARDTGLDRRRTTGRAPRPDRHQRRYWSSETFSFQSTGLPLSFS